LKKIGISEAEIKQRGLTIHNWRHFLRYLNTELLKQGFTISQVQGVTGHKSMGMTELYNLLTAEQITDVYKAQEVIAGTKKPIKEKLAKESEKANNKRRDLRLVNLPSRKST
jgi:integrase